MRRIAAYTIFNKIHMRKNSGASGGRAKGEYLMGGAVAGFDEVLGNPFAAAKGLPSGSASEVERSEASDQALAQRVAAGDVKSFEELYRRHAGRVYSVCLRMVANTTEAEDLTQEVFIQLFRKINSFRGESAFTTWLHRMAVNQVLMHFRRRRSRPELVAEEDEAPEAFVPGTENPNRMPIVDRIALDEAIAQLPNGYRAVFVLHDVEGYEHEEIARMLGCAAGTSKSQLHKARMKLRNLLRQRAPRG